MKKSDIIASLIIGEIISWFALGILKNIGLKIFGLETGVLYFVIPVLFPVLSLSFILLGFTLGKKIPIIRQAAKFVLVGALNTFVDLGVLNILLFLSGIASGVFYSVFKGAAFIVAATNSYFWNKFWVFESRKETTRNGKTGAGKEFSQFFLVSILGFIINVGTASLLVNIIGPQFGASAKIWANVGAIAAAFAGMTWNFLGYKFIVFKK